MKVLIIKMTSMGDIVHTFPALTDAGKAIANIRFDWVVENSFKELPRWHPSVDKVIPVAFRQWRKQPFTTLQTGAVFKALSQIRQHHYDLIIDAQGLLKSRIISCFARGTRCGFDKNSARESWANFIYHKKAAVEKNLHAVDRNRELFAHHLNYNLIKSTPDYGLVAAAPTPEDYLVFLPNTTWTTKHWPEIYWKQLITMATAANYKIKIPWGAAHEHERAKRLAENNDQVIVLPKASLTDAANIIANAKAVAALDTGLAHIAAAYNVPTVSLYGPTNPELTGTVGSNQIHLAAKFSCAPCFKRQCQFPGDKSIDPPCFSSIPPAMVWHELQQLL